MADLQELSLLRPFCNLLRKNNVTYGYSWKCKVYKGKVFCMQMYEKRKRQRTVIVLLMAFDIKLATLRRRIRPY